MLRRRAPLRKRRKLERAQDMADRRGELWRVFRYASDGSALASWRVVKAPSAQSAVKKVKRGQQATPILPSSEWREIYDSVGIKRADS